MSYQDHYDIMVRMLKIVIDEFQAKTSRQVTSIEVEDTGFNNGRPCPPIVRVSSVLQPQRHEVCACGDFKAIYSKNCKPKKAK